MPCHTVLIYVGETDRDAAIQRQHRGGAVGGVLGVGATETLRETAIAPGLYAREPSAGQSATLGLSA